MINITDKSECCGCNACGDVCAHNAITFKTDIEGFWYPEIDKDKCTDCGLCEKVCPIVNIEELKKNDFEKPECYAMQHKNLESLFNSTSGSAFAALAERMYKEGGYVGGAIYDENWDVKQFISSEKKDLEQLRNSKLVQSDAQGFYKAVRGIVQAGNKCLVCGLPCQMAALRAFLRKDYENLVIIDVICRGINTPKLLKGYMEILEERFQSKIIYFKVKNKEYGWRQLTTKVVFENGEVLYDTKDKNIFTLAYLQTNAFCRPSCYTCQFKGYPRIADITIADLWGKPGIIDKDMDHDLGTSLVLVNSRKGGNYYNKIVDKVKSKPIDFQTATVGNPALIKPLSAPKVDREEFFKDMECMPFKDLVRKYVKISSELPLSNKDKLKNTARFLLGVKRVCGWNLGTICKNIYYNLLCKAVKTNITEGKFMLIHKHCTFDIARTATIELGGILDFGSKRIRGSVLESRLLVDPHGKLITKGGVSIGYGADIEVFRDANLTFGADFSSNINATIICGHDITFDEKVSLGRDVTVRDNNGEHFISRRAYKNVRPVFIGKHSWLCEGSVIMPGTKLGAGVIVGARSFVAGGKFKNFTMLSGAPAVVVDEDVFVKM